MALIEVFTKYGDRTNYFVEVVKNQSIKIWMKTPEYEKMCSEYKIGDLAEYDSYNLSYFGEITKISEKQVEIVKRGKVRRLSIYEFCWRNANFNVEESSKANFDYMLYE